MVALFFLPTETGKYWTREAGPIEDFGAVMFLAGAVAAIAAAAQSRGLARVNFALWAFLALLFFGEETSYLQHWIGYPTPDWIATVNDQEEFNIHNLAPLDGGGSLRTDGINLETLLKSQNLFRMGFGTYFLLLPLAYFFSSRVQSLVRKLSIPIAGRNLLTAAWISISVSLVFVLLGGEAAPLAETRETIYGTTIGIFLIAHWYANRKLKRQPQLQPQREKERESPPKSRKSL